MAGSSSGARRLMVSQTLGLDGQTPPEMEDHVAFYTQLAGDDAEGEADGEEGLRLEEVLAFDGNIAELLDQSPDGKKLLIELGDLVVTEFDLDESERGDWKDSAERALEAAGQKKGDKKTYPISNGSANVKYPLLTTAAIQFAARAYPAIVRGDEVADVKVAGQDVDGKKAARAQRVADFCNDQIIYQCPEWEPGTDALLHQLPITGKAFRKVYWDRSLERPRFDFVPALKVAIPISAPSLEMSPRVTHILDVYPYAYEQKVASGEWLKCDVPKATGGDSQKPIVFLEQCRYYDMDEDGLSEPWIVTVHKETKAVVRIDPAFDAQDIRRHAETGKIRAIERLLPWIDYDFIPDPQGGVYAIGFGKLLEAISDTVNTLINQMIDAGHWSNTNTGFIGAGVKIRGGTVTLEPNSFKMVDGVADIRSAIQKLEFPGPSAVSFNLVEMLLAAAKDITAVKDVISGDMPGGQHVAEGTVMALIEQGLQVFTSIYKRIYRSMTREFELQCRLNARYLTQEDYQRFLDEQPPKPQPQAQGAPPQMMGHNGSPPMTPEDMGGGAPPPMQPGMAGIVPQEPMPGQGAPTQGGDLRAAMGAIVGPIQPQATPADPRADFNLKDMDVRPVSDPTSITEMQRMAKVQFLLALASQNPQAPLNLVEIYKRALKGARIDNVDQLLIEKNPALEAHAQLQQAGAQANVALVQAQGEKTKAEAQKIAAEAQAAQASAGTGAQDAQRGHDLKARELDQRDRELSFRSEDAARQHDREMYRLAMEDADKEARLAMDEDAAGREVVLEFAKLRREQRAAREEVAPKRSDTEAA